MSDTKLPPPSAWQLFRMFTRISLTSFGGGVSGWLMREFVQKRPYLTQEEFLSGLSLSQALPGINVNNVAIWIGYRLLGSRGAVIGFLAMTVPAAILVVLLGTLFSSLAHFSLTHVALAGAAAAAVGLSLSMGIDAARSVPRKLIPLGIMVGTFIAVGVLHLPLFWVVVCAGIVSVAHAFATA